MTTMTESHLIHQSSKLGDVLYSSDDVVRFAQGVPGFESLRDFLLVTREECEPFVLLTSLENADVMLPLVPVAPATLGMTAPDDVLQALGSAGEDALGYYAVVSIGVDAKEVIANLRAPIVVNLDTRLGCQVILADETLPLTAPLPV